MKSESTNKNYKPRSWYISNYGFSKTHWDMIFKLVGYVKTSDGKNAVRLMDENKYISYLESNAVKGTLELESQATFQ